MNSLGQFLKSKQFFIHLSIILVTVLILLFSLTKWLSKYTSHGEFVLVPDFRGQKIENLDNFIDTTHVKYQIIDSIYDPSEDFGKVIRQDPEPNSKVKHNRNIYLYVTGMVAPKIKMPKLIDRSERQARLVIETYGFKVGRVSYKKGECKGCVLSQSIKGREVMADALVNKGSTIDIVVGDDNSINGSDTLSNTKENKIDFDK
jgi:eukaryotic-like serine/threonine-protein kinase